jgi:hypothetical protein
MSEAILLINDAVAVGKINSEKVMVAVPLLYVFMVLTFLCRLIIYSKF